MKEQQRLEKASTDDLNQEEISAMPITLPRLAKRRTFLKKMLAAAAIAAAGIGTVSTAFAKRKNKGKQYGMLIDVRRCTGCHACSVACKSEFDVPLGYTRSWVEYVDKGEYPSTSRSFLPRLCNHCTKPSCVDVCPTGATYKRKQDGIVVIDEDVCIGCKYCILACPYDIRFLNPITGTADKCDFCIHRVEKGIAPSCVNTCTGRARIFGDLNDPTSEISQLVASHPVTVLRESMGTEPNVYYIAADHSSETDAYQNVKITTHRRQPERR